MFTFGSLFSGIGGLDLGLERSGMSCAYQIENDEYCLKVLNKHWPHVPKYGDIHHVRPEDLPTTDLIAGGFPCQPHSLAGKRRGKEDDRNLWPQFKRIIEHTRPRWVLAENVPGIRNTILDDLLIDLERMDYTTTTIDLPAVGFDARHLRHRFFIIAHTESPRRRENGQGIPGGSLVGSKSTLAHTHSQRHGRSETQQKPNHHQEWNDQTPEQKRRAILYEAVPGNQTVPDAPGQGLAQRQSIGRNNGTQQPAVKRSSRWAAEPNLGRVAHGVPNRVDRLRGLGNAVVPQVAHFLGEMILQVELANSQTRHSPLATQETQ